MIYLQTIEGLRSAPIQADFDESVAVCLYATEPTDDNSCDFAGEGGCSQDELRWGADDMGSPYFCTNHFFPVEQLGYELYEVAA